MGLNQLYTGHTGKSSKEKAFNKVLSTSWQCVSRGVVVMKQPGVQKVGSSIPGRTCFPLLFSSSFLSFSFTFSHLFSYCNFVLFLYIP